MVIARDGCRLKKFFFSFATVYCMVLTIISRGRKNDERKQTIPQTVLLAWEQNVGTEPR